MYIKITADSSCDLPKELLNRYNITTIPLCIIKDNVSFFDGVDITPQDIFDHVKNGGDICTTSAININDYSEFFAKFASDYEAVIHISLCSEISTCFRNATLAAESFPNVHVVDSRLLSSGQGSLAILAAEMANDGMTAEDICNKLTSSIIPNTEGSFVLDRLDFMYKGGRCSSVQFLGANLLKLKPCIELKDGIMGVTKKYRGKLEKCLCDYVKDKLSGRTDLSEKRIIITSTFFDPDEERHFLDLVENEVAKYVHFDEIIEARAGCTISCHCGPGTLGFFALRK